MKKLSTVFLLCLSLASCSNKFIQVFDSKSENTKQTAFLLHKSGSTYHSYNSYVYENDTLKITYSFWANKGVLAFSVYNKSDKPLYIKWENSSFTYNGNKLNYTTDSQQVNGENHNSYYYKEALTKDGHAINNHFHKSVGGNVNSVAITYIPPKSFYYRSQFHLLPVDFFKIDKEKMTKTLVQRNNNSKKKIPVYEENFNMSNTPLRFSNNLAFTFSDTSTNFYFVNNEFYITSVKEMISKGKSSYENMNSFYIQIDSRNTVDYPDNNWQTEFKSDSMYEAGKQDAATFYNDKHAATASFLATLIGTPVLGLIPAIACSAKMPKKFLDAPPGEHDADYITGYRVQARKIKKKKIWRNYILASCIDLVIGELLIKSGTQITQ